MRPLVAIACLYLGLAACSSPPQENDHARLRLDQVLAETAADGFARADRPRPFTFPADHGPHPRFRSEWWYFTGNLETPQGRRFGYQWTLFRFALSPRAVQRPSQWATDQIYMAHFTLTDARNGRFRYFEKVERGALGLAGAQAQPLRLWIDGWQLQAEAASDWRLSARGSDGSAIALRLQPAKPVVLQGDEGLSRKSDAPGNASYYYSIPRLRTTGTLVLNGERYPVSGLSWMDREWSTSALAPDQAGWDWFSLQLDDGSDLMWYRLRNKDGSIDPHSAGTLIDAQGNAHHLDHASLQAEVLSHWRSADGVEYPARWRLRVPDRQLELEVTPVVADQELHASVRYWEGAVDVRGTHAGKTVQGRGYMELAGYGARN